MPIEYPFSEEPNSRRPTEVRAPHRSLLLDVLHSRRSIAPKHLVEPPPSPSELRLIIETGLAAPDHGNLRRWRMVAIPWPMRATLAAVFEAAKLEETPAASAEDRQKSRAKAWNAPLLLAVLFEPDGNHPVVPVDEQLLALGAALQNMLLAAHALGYGAMITSGRKIRTEALQSAFVRSPSEELMAFVSFGTPARTSRPREAALIERHVSIWDGMST
ncbi:MAG: nitroreductase [Rhodomicrobium sp.]